MENNLDSAACEAESLTESVSEAETVPTARGKLPADNASPSTSGHVPDVENQPNITDGDELSNQMQKMTLNAQLEDAREQFADYEDDRIFEDIGRLYHVTRLRTDEDPNATYPELRANAGRYEHYDGPLDTVDGAPHGVFFTGTLFKGGLPTITEYPSDGDGGKSYRRVALPINELFGDGSGFSFFFVKDAEPPGSKTTIQVLIVAVPKTRTDAIAWCEENLAPLDVSKDPFLRCAPAETEEGVPRWRVLRRGWHEGFEHRDNDKFPMKDVWTNFFVVPDVGKDAIDATSGDWDSVQKSRKSRMSY